MLSSATLPLSFFNSASHWTNSSLIQINSLSDKLQESCCLPPSSWATGMSHHFLPVGVAICRSPCLHGKYFTNWAIFPAVPLDFYMIIYWLAYWLSTVKSSMCCQKHSLDYNFKYQFCECFVSLLFKESHMKPFLFVPSSIHIHLLLTSKFFFMAFLVFTSKVLFILKEFLFLCYKNLR